MTTQTPDLPADLPAVLKDARSTVSRLDEEIRHREEGIATYEKHAARSRDAVAQMRADRDQWQALVDHLTPSDT